MFQKAEPPCFSPDMVASHFLHISNVVPHKPYVANVEAHIL